MLQNNKVLEQVTDALKHFPHLHLRTLGEKIFLAGRIELFDEAGKFIDSYEIEIHPTDNYPDNFPKLYEVGGQIPRNIDWHVYSDGSCCLAVQIEEIIACRQRIGLTEFIRKYVCGFLFSQTFRKRNGYFYRERSHGFMGTLEYYKEVLGLQSISSVYDALQIATSKAEIKSNSKCFCGSNKKFQKCHRMKLRELVKLAGGAVEATLKELEDAIRSLRNNA